MANTVLPSRNIYIPRHLPPVYSLPSPIPLIFAHLFGENIGSGLTGGQLGQDVDSFGPDPLQKCHLPSCTKAYTLPPFSILPLYFAPCLSEPWPLQRNDKENKNPYANIQRRLNKRLT